MSETNLVTTIDAAADLQQGLQMIDNGFHLATSACGRHELQKTELYTALCRLREQCEKEIEPLKPTVLFQK